MALVGLLILLPRLSYTEFSLAEEGVARAYGAAS